MPPGQRVDWFRVFADLSHQGFALTDVADVTSIPRTTLIHWKDDGVEPRHKDGESLLEFWSSATGMARSDAPMAQVETSAGMAKR